MTVSPDRLAQFRDVVNVVVFEKRLRKDHLAAGTALERIHRNEHQLDAGGDIAGSGRDRALDLRALFEKLRKLAKVA
jgi:hypothetical protein